MTNEDFWHWVLILIVSVICYVLGYYVGVSNVPKIPATAWSLYIEVSEQEYARHRKALGSAE